jgi:hypothetical protein
MFRWFKKIETKLKKEIEENLNRIILLLDSFNNSSNSS